MVLNRSRLGGFPTVSSKDFIRSVPVMFREYLWMPCSPPRTNAFLFIRGSILSLGDRATAEENRMLWRAVRALPEPFRTPTILRYSCGMDSPEIAKVLSRPAGTVRYQLSRAHQILRERLESDWTK